MGAGPSTHPFESVEAALASGKTQAEIDAYLNHFDRLPDLPALADVEAVLRNVNNHLRKVAASVAPARGGTVTKEHIQQALHAAFVEKIPVPKDDSHHNVSLGPVLDNFQNLTDHKDIAELNDDTLRAKEENVKQLGHAQQRQEQEAKADISTSGRGSEFAVVNTTATKSKGVEGVGAAAEEDEQTELAGEKTAAPPNQAVVALRKHVRKLHPVMKKLIDLALKKPGRTFMWVKVMAAGNEAFSKVYRSVWEFVQKNETVGWNAYLDELKLLAGVLAPHADRTILQPELGGDGWGNKPDDLVDLYLHAAFAQPGFKRVMARVAELFRELSEGAKNLNLSVCRKLKKVTRILEKMIMRGSVRGVKDIVRAMAIVDSMLEVALLIKIMLRLHEEGVIDLLRSKDRFQNPSSGGWRGG